MRTFSFVPFVLVALSCTASPRPSDAASAGTPARSQPASEVDGVGKEEVAPAVVEPVIIVVVAEAPGMSPAEVEELVTTRVEASLDGLRGIERMESESRAGSMWIGVTIERDVDVDAARHGIAERLHQVRSLLPEEVELSLEASPAPTTQSVAFVVRPRESSPEEVGLVVRRLRQALLETRGVGHVDLCGEPAQQVLVSADPQRLNALGISVDTLRLALSINGHERGIVGGGGLVKATGGSVEELGNIVVSTAAASRSGAPVMLKDVATIEMTRATPECDAADVNGTATLVGLVWPNRDTDAAKIEASIRGRLSELRDSMPADGVRLELLPTSTTILLELPALREPERTISVSAARIGEALGPQIQGILRAPTPLEAGAPVDAELLLTAPSLDLLRTIEEKLMAIPGLHLRDLQAPGIPERLRVRVTAADLDQAHNIAEQIATAAASVPGVLSARARVGLVPEIEIDLDRDKLARFGISPYEFNRITALALHDLEVARITAGDRDLPVLLRLGSADRPPLDPDDLIALQLPLPDGGTVPLAQVAQVRTTAAPRSVHRLDGQRSIDVEIRLASLDARAPLTQHIISTLDLPPGVALVWE